MTTTSQPVGYVVSHTHWDREWRYPIWKNRMLLIEMFDHLLETLETQPEYRNFVLDGQCVAVEDYLEIRPEREQRIRRQVAARRLSIGPWYTLPDLYPVAGECLVRNLLKGTRLAKRYGGYLPIGYNSFGWGQTAQFPQIYKEFGIDFIIAAKNVSRQRAPHCEYWWESPDGTRVLSTRLGQHARANFFFNATIPIRYGMEYLSDRYRFVWGCGGPVIHAADHALAQSDYLRIAQEEGFHSDQLRNAIDAAWHAMDDTAAKDCRLLLSGSDFTGAQPELPRIVTEANRLFPDRRFVHATLEEYVAHLRRVLDLEKLEVVRGELRDGPPQAASANALATRIHVKQLNKQAENALIHRAEPLCALMAMFGAEYPRSFLDIAWRYLLLAHSHDSINGVTQDKTVADTVGNLRQALEIAEVVYEQATAELVRQIDLSGYQKEDVLLVLVNPLPHPTNDVVRVCVDTPQGQSLWDFGLVDDQGRQSTVQHEGRREMTVPVHDPDTRPWPFYADRHTVHVEMGEIPAGGYKVLRLVPGETFDRKAEFWASPRTSRGDEIAAALNMLENEFLKVVVAPNGTIDLLDKDAGRWLRGLLQFEDAGDVGDYWIYYPPYENRTFTSLGSPARIWLEENGPLAATVGVELSMTLPAFGYRPENYVRGKSRRSDETRDLAITSRLTLKKGSRRLEVKTQVANTVRDHRLRLMLPCGVRAKDADAAGHFTVDRRPAAPVHGPDGVFHPEMQTLPMQSFIDVGDGQFGLVVLNNCFTEYEAIDGQETTLAITLFRAVRNIICTEYRSAGVFPNQHGGQLQQKLEYHYALVPHRGDWRDADLFRLSQSFNTPPTTVQTTAHRLGQLPTCTSLLDLESDDLVFAAMKKAEDRETYMVRLFNPGETSARGMLRMRRKIQSAWRCTLDEQRCEEFAVQATSAVEIVAGPGKIVTLELEMD